MPASPPGAARVRHPLPPVRWPAREEAERSLWFSPARVGPLAVEQRTWVPAMVPWRATEDGFVTPDVLEWYGRFAEGRPGVLVVEATGIRDVPAGRCSASATTGSCPACAGWPTWCASAARGTRASSSR